MYDFKLNGINASSLGVYAVQRPDIPTPKKRIEKKTIIGRDGILTIDDGSFEEISFAVECNFMASSSKSFGDCCRRIRSWIYSNQQSELLFNDDANYFYKTQIIEISDIKRTSRRIGLFTLNCTCNPFVYLSIGKQAIDISPVLVNLYYQCKPIFKLYGEGVFKITVNGSQFIINVAQNATVDSELMLIYREDNGTLINQYSTGNFEDLWLKNGNNSISVSMPNKGTAKIIPNWRSI